MRYGIIMIFTVTVWFQVKILVSFGICGIWYLLFVDSGTSPSVFGWKQKSFERLMGEDNLQRKKQNRRKAWNLFFLGYGFTVEHWPLNCRRNMRDFYIVYCDSLNLSKWGPFAPIKTAGSSRGSRHVYIYIYINTYTLSIYLYIKSISVMEQLY